MQLIVIWVCSGDENQPEDHVRYARNDLMGLVREDLGYDMAVMLIPQYTCSMIGVYL